MEVAPLPFLTPEVSIKETFEIKQDSKIYKLNIEIENQNIILNLSDEKILYEEYESNLTFDELKNIHKAFSMLNSTQEFIEYIKVLIQNNKLTINKENEYRIIINMIVEYLYKQNTIEIDLKLKKINTDKIVKNLSNQINILYEKLQKVENNYSELKEENKNIKEDYKKIKDESDKIINENKIIKEENKKLNEKFNQFEIIIDYLKKQILSLKIENKETKEKIDNRYLSNSSIMKEGEFEMIKSTINNLMNLEIKEIKKLFQATIDGSEPKDFHNKCDDIKNTLVLYKSKGNRRFGGFTSESWENKNIDKTDKYCFLFSLDNNKIFTAKDNTYFKIVNNSSNGPSFSYENFYCISIEGNAFNNNSLKTYESYHKSIFDGEINILSEDGYFNGTSCKDFEVFQVIF
jgi:hypothetical protein